MIHALRLVPASAQRVPTAEDGGILVARSTISTHAALPNLAHARTSVAETEKRRSEKKEGGCFNQTGHYHGMRTCWLRALAISVTFAGCMYGGMSGLPKPAPGEPVGEVVLIRTSNIVGAPNSYLITVDGRRAWGLRVGEYARFKVTAGAHRIGVECFGGWAPIWRESDAAELKVQADTISYLLVGPDLNCASIKAISDAEGRDRLSQSKPSR